jgi:hypothetical protein
VVGFSRRVGTRGLVFEAISQIDGRVVLTLDDLLVQRQGREGDLKTNNIAFTDAIVELDRRGDL